MPQSDDPMDLATELARLGMVELFDALVWCGRWDRERYSFNLDFEEIGGES